MKKKGNLSKLMRIKGILLFCLLLSTFFITLDAHLFAQEDEESSDWFMRWRAWPNDTIPESMVLDALTNHQQIIQTGDFYAGPTRFWTCIGPIPRYSSDCPGVPRSGRVTCVKYYPNVPNHQQHPDWIYTAGHNGGIFKSEDNGSTFRPLTDNFVQTQASGCIAFDPNNPNNMYYGTGGNVYGFAYNYPGVGVYKSTDAGETWTGPYRVNHPDGPQAGLPIMTTVFKIVVDPQYSNIVYLADGHDPFYGENLGGGLYRSTDYGVTWARASGTPEGGCNDVVINYNGETQSRRIFAVGIGSYGYYTSDNNGVTFVQRNHNDGVFYQGKRTQMAVSSDGSKIYAVSAFSDDNTYPPTGTRGVYAFISNNNGTNFTVSVVDDEAFYDWGYMPADFMFIQTSPSNSALAIVGYGTGLYSGCYGFGMRKTTDGGSTFSSMTPYGTDQNCLDFNPYSGQGNEISLGND